MPEPAKIPNGADIIESTLLDTLGVYSGSDNNPEVDPVAYDASFVAERLSDAGAVELYRGSEAYQMSYESLTRNYADKNEIPVNDSDLNNRRFFREAFIRLVAEKASSNEGRFSGNERLRQTHPERCNIKMVDLLGSEGVRLYKLALEEEMQSKEYMNAVFRSSTQHFEGKRWLQRPAVVVSGPSGCGKSFAAQRAVEKACEFLPKVDGDDNSGNDVVSVDGGVARQVSQMRALAASLAMSKGYTGIKDLHENSKILEGVKNRILETAIATPALGIVIPETFSGFMSVMDSSRRMLKRLLNLESTKAVFCRVKGDNPSLFQKVVAFMGSRRAWKTTEFNATPLTMNGAEIPESKAYGAQGFKFGEYGSQLAEKWFVAYCRKHRRENLSMIITNDLLLKKPAWNRPDIWVDAEQGDPGAILVSKRVYEQWDSLRLMLADVPAAQRPKVPTLEEFKNMLNVPPLVQTSAGIDIAVAKESIRKRMSAVGMQMLSTRNVIKYELLRDKSERLKTVFDILNLITDASSKEDIQAAKSNIQSKLSDMKSDGHFSMFFSKSKSSVKQALSALDKLEKEVHVEAPAKDIDLDQGNVLSM
ncbi:hypothetical protein [Legionella sp. CNM-4043-24]|uniref:hypothetical protein n=1 Tax=Legionella sp. CNM-4043-24 TaxID=3421646 RepID=UPI00403B309E